MHKHMHVWYAFSCAGDARYSHFVWWYLCRTLSPSICQTAGRCLEVHVPSDIFLQSLNEWLLSWKMPRYQVGIWQHSCGSFHKWRYHPYIIYIIYHPFVNEIFMDFPLETIQLWGGCHLWNPWNVFPLLVFPRQSPGEDTFRFAHLTFQASGFPVTKTPMFPMQQMGGFHGHGGSPIAGWFRSENPT